MSAILSLQNVEFQYPGSLVPTLKGLNLEVQKGESVFLYGPSGTGKTTLLEIIAGVLSVTNGRHLFLQNDMGKSSAAERDLFRADHIGYVFQSFNLIPYLTVRENIELGLAFSSVKRQKASQNQNQVQDLTDRLGISNILNKQVTELSVGQQQRVAVARALYGSPELILADEPTSALDFDHREKFIDLLFSVTKQTGATVVFVSHDRTLEKKFSRALSLDQLQEVRA